MSSELVQSSSSAIPTYLNEQINKFQQEDFPKEIANTLPSKLVCIPNKNNLVCDKENSEEEAKPDVEYSQIYNSVGV